MRDRPFRVIDIVVSLTVSPGLCWAGVVAGVLTGEVSWGGLDALEQADRRRPIATVDVAIRRKNLGSSSWPFSPASPRNRSGDERNRGASEALRGITTCYPGWKASSRNRFTRAMYPGRSTK